MLQAMNTGHDGSLTTVHANSTEDSLIRLETLASMSDVDVPFQALRDQINSAIDVIVQLERSADGRRRIIEVAAISSRLPRLLPPGHDHGASIATPSAPTGA